MDLSIIIPSFNTRTLLVECLLSIFNSSIKYPFEVIVIDNHSTDGSLQMVREKFPQVLLIENTDNLGFSRANNQGAKITKGEYLLFLNSDTQVLDDGITKLLDFAHRHPNDVIGAKLLNKDLSPQTSCGPHFSLPVIFIMLLLKGDQLGITRYSPKYEKVVGWVSGACFVVRKSVFDKVGGFDEDIFMYLEEVELQYRIEKLGGKIIFFPDACFIHIGGASSQGKNKPVMNIYKGLMYLHKKHQPVWKQQILFFLLALKAAIAIMVGTFIRDRNLVATYKNAYEIIAH